MGKLLHIAGKDLDQAEVDGRAVVVYKTDDLYNYSKHILAKSLKELDDLLDEGDVEQKLKAIDATVKVGKYLDGRQRYEDSLEETSVDLGSLGFNLGESDG